MADETDRPLLRSLAYVVQLASTQTGDEPLLLAGRVAQAALLWHRADQVGNFEEAEKWLAQLPQAVEGDQWTN